MGRSQNVSKIIQMNGEILPYRVEQRSVRYPRLEFKTNELLVILPKGWKDEAPLLEEKKSWIFKKHLEIKSALEKLRGNMKGKSSLPIFGDFFELRQSSSLVLDLEQKVIYCDLDDGNQVRRLAAILKKMLVRELLEAAEHYSNKFGVRFRRICVKRQRTKWGSCSFRGNLNFNLWLVCLPRDLVWYLVCHEVAHLKESNHRKAFWNLVGQEFANYKEMEKMLFEYWFFFQNTPLLCSLTRRIF